MIRKLLVALIPLCLSNYAVAGPETPSTQAPRTGHIEVSINDLPEGSSKDLGAAMRVFGKRLDTEGTGIMGQGASNKMLRSTISGEITRPEDHIYQVDNASLSWLKNSAPALTDYSQLKITPSEVNITSACKIIITQPNGIFSKKQKKYTGFARFYQCQDGEVFTRDMTFDGVRKLTIKEQKNLTFRGGSGVIYGARDTKGNTNTTLKWVSNNIDHFVQKTGATADTRQWLIRYAEEIVAKERQ